MTMLDRVVIDDVAETELSCCLCNRTGILESSCAVQTFMKRM